uniref:Uncharacterized protein n=1 Tax=Oncorhynchus mykiss TaxID=8022 RepID=A0A8K9X3X0_ONCMY
MTSSCKDVRSIFDLSKYIDIPIRGFDPLLNLLLDETHTHVLSPCLLSQNPLEEKFREEEPLSFSSIPNTFLQQQEG